MRQHELIPQRPQPTFLPPLSFPSYNQQPNPNSHLPATCKMLHLSRQTHFYMLFNLFTASLQQYKKQTGIALPEHLLTEQLQYSDSPMCITAILQEQAPDCSKFRGSNKIMKLLSSIVSVLYTLFVSVDLNWVCSRMPIRLFHP